MRTILRLFVSLKTAVVLICLLTVLSMLGTFIPQSLEAHEYLERFPGSGHLILALGFDDMYHGLAFQLCLWFLSISTLVCILTRWKSTSRRLFSRLKNAGEKEIKAFEVGKIISAPSPERLNKVFTQIEERENGLKIGLRTSGKASLLGGMFIHIGFLAILAGGLIGVFYGVEMAVRGRVGDKVAIPSVDAVRAARDADSLSRKARNLRHFSPNAAQLEDYRVEVEKLHKVYMDGLASPAFKVAFKDLWVDHHFDESGNPTSIKSWNSAIAFLQNDEMVASGVTMVNQPLSFKDYTFYQANWNKTYGRISVRVDLIKDKADWQTFVTPGATFPVTIELSLENPASFSFTPLKLVLHDFMPDFRILDGRFVSVSHELKNPAARIVAYDQKGGIVGRAWAFPDDRIMSASHVSNLPFLFTFIGAEPEFESGLQMAYDPGKPLVWAGCFLFTLGLIMGFYVAYREEWIVVFDDDRARIALTGNRPAEMLLPGLEALEKELSEPAETKPDQENSQNE
jgi:cytochrome c biogenesis protein